MTADAVAAASAAAAVVVAAKVQQQGQIVAAATMVIACFTRRGAVPHGDPNWQQTAMCWLFFAMFHVDLYLRCK